MLPSFIIAGAAKSGTTALYHALQLHPEVFLPELKEPNFFIADFLDGGNPESPRLVATKKRLVRSLDHYESLFHQADTSQRIGEASVQYLTYWRSAIPAIKHTLGDPKIILGLRNPAERAFSSYKHLQRDGHEPLTFAESLAKEAQRESDDWRSILYAYREAGKYAEQVRAYQDNFSEVWIYLYDDFEKDPRSVYQECCRFLEIEDSPVPESIHQRRNASLKPSSELADKLLFKPSRTRSTINAVARGLLGEKVRSKLVYSIRQQFSKAPSGSAETLQKLRTEFAADINELEVLLQRDLSAWMN